MTKKMTKKMEKIVGIDVDYRNIPSDWQVSNDPNAINYRLALARASNAIEGVVFTNEEKACLDSIPLELSDKEMAKAILKFVNED